LVVTYLTDPTGEVGRRARRADAYLAKPNIEEIVPTIMRLLEESSAAAD
jgi:hypothetical protein